MMANRFAENIRNILVLHVLYVLEKDVVTNIRTKTICIY